MGERLRDKVAIVTGGAAGIGRATAEMFAEQGASVVVADLDESAGIETAEGISARGGAALFVRTDVSSESDAQMVCERAAETFGGLHILVNNAAAFVLRGLEATPEEWARSLGVNVVGTALMSRFAAMHIKRSGGGAIVNLGSMSGFIAQPNFTAYSATKAAIVQMTRNMALDLAPDRIRVNCVCPGTILTRASCDHMQRTQQSLEEFIAAEAPKTMLGRIGEPREAAAAILFLASDEASFITGAYLCVDGGYTAL
ncbi:MAG: SDR family oxidoreductase [Acidobacteria bacterium]|nr:SDR family oxidoreductase [Acidobacteriota bacterium]MCW5971190.1 SDR family oxidoreductase [Blastocatellales bacterium]